MDHDRGMAQLRHLQDDMMQLNESLEGFKHNVFSENFEDVYDKIVDSSVTNIGTSNTFRIPKMYQVQTVFGRLQCLAIDRHLFHADEIKNIEAKLGRKMDKFDTIYVKKPKNGGAQDLMILRLVKARDVGCPKL